MKERRGGPRKGAGLKKGTIHKNALKTPSKRRTVKKQVSYTQKEFRRVTDAMAACGYTKHTEFCREAVLFLTGMILANGKEDTHDKGRVTKTN